jgi:hypothetical protein
VGTMRFNEPAGSAPSQMVLSGNQRAPFLTFVSPNLYSAEHAAEMGFLLVLLS